MYVHRLFLIKSHNQAVRKNAVYPQVIITFINRYFCAQFIQSFYPLYHLTCSCVFAGFSVLCMNIVKNVSNGFIC